MASADIRFSWTEEALSAWMESPCPLLKAQIFSDRFSVCFVFPHLLVLLRCLSVKCSADVLGAATDFRNSHCDFRKLYSFGGVLGLVFFLSVQFWDCFIVVLAERRSEGMGALPLLLLGRKFKYSTII